MKKIFLFLTISLFITSCNDDDDSCNNFLDCHNNSVWESNFGGETIYHIFHNNNSNPVTEWHKDINLNCFYFLNIEDVHGELIDVSDNRIVFKIPHPEMGVYRNLTFTNNGNTINLKIEIFENEISKSVQNYVLNRSSFNPQNIQICSSN